MAIELPIQRGQKFLSNKVEVEIVCVNGKKNGCPIIDDYGDCYTKEGKYFDEELDELDLQPIPEPEIVIPEGVDFQITSEALREKCLGLQKSGRRFTRGGISDNYCAFDSEWIIYRMLPIAITEGVEFSGEQYRAEFERLLKIEGREFQVRGSDNVLIPLGLTEYVPHCKYVMLPQHRDANGHPLKVGDRVQMLSSTDTITGFNGRFAQFADGVSWPAKKCRKLTTRTRPLCAADLDKAPCPMFLDNEDPGQLRIHPQWVKSGVYLYWETLETWESLTNSKYQWRPSADQPWGPCEVTEEVLV